MTHAPAECAPACARMARAAEAKESPEVLSALMEDLARELVAHGQPEHAARVRRNAAGVAALHGVHARQARARLPWWRRPGYRAPDYPARLAAYRRDER